MNRPEKYIYFDDDDAPKEQLCPNCANKDKCPDFDFYEDYRLKYCSGYMPIVRYVVIT
jgi:hypothetical protein